MSDWTKATNPHMDFSVRFVKEIPLTKECDNETVFSASPQYLPSDTPPNADEMRIMATLARIEAKLDQLLARPTPQDTKEG